MPYSSISKFVVRVLIVLSFGVMGVVLAEASDPLQDDPPVQQSPQDCATCHVDIVSTWQEGTHAQAFADPIFQEAWEKQDNNSECLACHTTGYVAYSGEYTHEGVTCEACHGVTPANHPAEPVAINKGAEACADCHSTTFNEWQMSAHGDQQLACTTCHNPHPQQLRFEDANTLCLNCHDEAARDDYVHLTHVQQECVDCHWHRGDREDLLAHYETGNLFPTGHEAMVETVSCVSCHAEISETGIVEEGEEIRDELGLTSAHPLHEARVRIEELESEVHTLEAQGANTSSLRLAQGFVLGIALGGILIFAVSRFSRRSSDVKELEEE